MTYCDYHEDSCGLFVCSVCGDRKPRAFVRECRRRMNTARVGGVGHELMTILKRRYSIPACQRCHNLAARMDELGAMGCRQHIDELANSLKQNAKRLNWQQVLAVVTNPVSSSRGVAGLARRGDEMFRDLILEAIESVESRIAEITATAKIEQHT